MMLCFFKPDHWPQNSVQQHPFPISRLPYIHPSSLYSVPICKDICSIAAKLEMLQLDENKENEKPERTVPVPEIKGF